MGCGVSGCKTQDLGSENPGQSPATTLDCLPQSGVPTSFTSPRALSQSSQRLPPLDNILSEPLPLLCGPHQLPERADAPRIVRHDIVSFRTTWPRSTCDRGSPLPNKAKPSISINRTFPYTITKVNSTWIRFRKIF